MQIGYILPSIATFWTTPEHPRKVDFPAVSSSADIPLWLAKLTFYDRLWLIRHNAVQTQALFGTRIQVLEQKEEWSFCVIPDQFTPKHEAGYPGWIPTKQLGFDEIYHIKYDSSLSVWVTSPKAELTIEQNKRTVSFMTRLPFQKQTDEMVYVYLPTGKVGWFKNNEVTISSEPGSAAILAASYPMLPKKDGAQIVEMGKQFLGVPYLWSGMSCYAFDCSGYTHSMYKAAGILIHRDASAQFHHGKEKGLVVPHEQLQAGDLVFFENESGRIDHVAIYSGRGEILHASNSNYHIKIESLWKSKYAKRYCGAIRFWC